jgi:hypothetical protein
MYAQPMKKNVTYIDDLPDLDDLESGGGFNTQHMEEDYNQPKYQKFIRNPGGIPPPHPESGMNNQGGQKQQQNEFFEPPQQKQQANMRPISDTPSCLEIHDHIQQCPICSRFYKNDNTVYIIAIVILSIICILLLKKVLNL